MGVFIGFSIFPPPKQVFEEGMELLRYNQVRCFRKIRGYP